MRTRRCPRAGGILAEEPRLAEFTGFERRRGRMQLPDELVADVAAPVRSVPKTSCSASTCVSIESSCGWPAERSPAWSYLLQQRWRRGPFWRSGRPIRPGAGSGSRPRGRLRL